MFARFNQCLTNSLVILTSVSGFVYSELRFLNGLGFFRSQRPGLVAREEDFHGGGCYIENRALDGSEIPALSLSPAV